MNGDRRTFIRTVGAGSVLGATSMIAGCGGGDGGDGDGTGDGTDGTGDGGDGMDGDGDGGTDGGDGDGSGGINRGGTIMMSQTSDVINDTPGMIPHTAGGRATREIMMNIGNTLTQVNPQTTEVDPDLATSWEFADDGLSITFQLEEGVQFHPPYDREMTAQDVVENYERILDPEYGSPALAPFEGNMIDDSTDPSEVVEANGDYEVTFHFLSPFPNVLEAVANDRLCIIPMESREEFGDSYGQPDGGVVGTGPFMFEESSPGNQHRFVKNPNYFREGEDGEPLPYADELIFKVMPEAGARRSALVAGDLNVTGEIPGGAYSQFQNASGVTVEAVPSLRLNVIWMNYWYGDLAQDLHFRRALQFAVNPTAVNQATYEGLGEPATTIIPSTMEREDLSYSAIMEDVTDYGVDEVKVDEAENELSQSEFSDIEEFDLLTDDPTEFVSMGTVVEQNLRQIGLQPNIRPTPRSSGWAQWVGQWQSGGPPEDQPMIIQNISRRSFHPDDWTNWAYRDGAFANLGYWQDEEFMEMSDESRATADPERRAELYHEMCVYVTEQAVYPLLVYNPVIQAWRDEVQNFQAAPTEALYFENVWLDE